MFGLWLVAVGLVTGHRSEELRAVVARRLAAGERHSSQVALGEGEDSPLQSSKRSSTFIDTLYLAHQRNCLIDHLLVEHEIRKNIFLFAFGIVFCFDK